MGIALTGRSLYVDFIPYAVRFFTLIHKENTRGIYVLEVFLPGIYEIDDPLFIIFLEVNDWKGKMKRSLIIIAVEPHNVSSKRETLHKKRNFKMIGNAKTLFWFFAVTFVVKLNLDLPILTLFWPFKLLQPDFFDSSIKRSICLL